MRSAWRGSGRLVFAYLRIFRVDSVCGYEMICGAGILLSRSSWIDFGVGE